MSANEEQTAAPARRSAGRSRLRTKLFAAVLALLFALIVAEIVLRLTWHNSYRGDSADLLVKLGIHHRNLDYVIDRSMIDPEDPRVRLRTDDRSYILPSSRYDDPDAIVAFLGGSTTECSAVREELRFPALVSDLLAERGFHVNTLNAAAAGNTLHESINVLFNHVVEDAPDIVVVMHATNDMGILIRHGSYATRMGRPMKAKDVQRWLRQLVSRHCFVAAAARKVLSKSGVRELDAEEMRDRNSIHWAAHTPIELFEKRLRVFVGMARDLGIQPVLMTQPLSTASNHLTPQWANLGAQDRLNNVIRAVGIAENVPVIDLVAYMAKEYPERRNTTEIFYDGMHVTDKGSRAYAECIAGKLFTHVRAAAAARGRFERKK